MAVKTTGHEEDLNDILKLNVQLQVALVSLGQDEADEALTVIENHEKSHGLDAWRRFYEEYAQQQSDQSSVLEEVARIKVPVPRNSQTGHRHFGDAVPRPP